MRANENKNLDERTQNVIENKRTWAASRKGAKAQRMLYDLARSAPLREVLVVELGLRINSQESHTKKIEGMKLGNC